jgi:hypothetical protein
MKGLGVCFPPLPVLVGGQLGPFTRLPRHGDLVRTLLQRQLGVADVETLMAEVAVAEEGDDMRVTWVELSGVNCTGEVEDVMSRWSSLRLSDRG